MAYESMDNDAHTWADIQTALQQSSPAFSEKLSGVVSNIAGIQVSDQTDSIKSTQVAVAWDCLTMVQNLTVVSSKPYYICSGGWG